MDEVVCHMITPSPFFILSHRNLDYNERMAWPRHNSISRCLFSTRDLILWTADRDKGLHFYSIIDGQHHKVTSFGQLTAPPPSSSSTVPNGGAAAAGGGNFSFDSTSSVCCYGDKVFFTGMAPSQISSKPCLERLEPFKGLGTI